MIFVFLPLAIVGAIADYRYIRKGGMRPTREPKRNFAMAVAVCVGGVALIACVTGAWGVAPVGLAFLPGLFCMWEFARFRMRIKYPLDEELEKYYSPEMREREREREKRKGIT